MRKICLSIIFTLAFSFSAFAEDLSKININTLKKLSDSQIISAISNKKLFGYMESYGIPFDFEETHYSDGDYSMTVITGIITAKWKVNNNRLCYKVDESLLTPQAKMYDCSVTLYAKNNRLYFHTNEQGIYAVVTRSIDLIN